MALVGRLDKETSCSIGRYRLGAAAALINYLPLLTRWRLRMKLFGMTVMLTLAFLSSALAQNGEATRGQGDFRACAPCHSLEPDRNMTGPSLACLWGRKAGSLPSFERYSDALKSSGIIWDDPSLDGWLTDPQA